ncbi:MAG: L,D-transpeptidase, partial [Novosphingobium sp.]|nr:L,D-transpeptidase [Novosphingobium sp.]
MTTGDRKIMRSLGGLTGVVALLLAIEPARGQPAGDPPQPAPWPLPATQSGSASPQSPSMPVIQPLTVVEPVMAWTRSNALALLEVIRGIDAEGLIPADYQPDALAAAIAAGEGPELDRIASQSFAWLVEDLRDGRTPM